MKQKDESAEINSELRAKLDAELEFGERAVWVGAPAGRKPKAVYAITGRRAIVIERGWFSTWVRSYDFRDFLEIHRIQWDGGLEDIVFDHYFTSEDSAALPIGFLGITGAKEVQRILEAQIESALAQPAGIERA